MPGDYTVHFYPLHGSQRHKSNIVHGTRTSDGKQVCVKRVKTKGEESIALSILLGNVQRVEAANHCVPVLDFLQDPEEPAVSFLIMSRLRHINTSHFRRVQDVVNFVSQVLVVRVTPLSGIHGLIT